MPPYRDSDSESSDRIAPSRVDALGQLVFCQGCCCGRTDRERPELPVDRLKSAWKAGKLNRTVQLAISGCLGPCDKSNVTLVLTPDEQIWLGELEGPETYEALIGWAAACHAAGQMLPLPERFDRHRFERWAAAEVAT